MMGNGNNLVQASNVLDDYSVIYINVNVRGIMEGILFRCVTGLGPSDSNNEIGNLYFNGMLLPKSDCSGYVKAKGAKLKRYSGVLNARVCRNFTTSTEGIYTCTLTNSSMMNQSMSVGVYFNVRSKSFHDS